MTSELVAAFGFGAALGAATGVPLGVVNVAVIEAATRAGARAGAAIGIGGALADGVHASLAFAGVARVVTGATDLRRALMLASAAVVIAYAIVVWRRRGAGARPAPVRRWRGVALGLSLTLPNPAPLAAWVAVAGVVVPAHATIAVALCGAAGVALGSAAWFALLARIAARGTLGGRWGTWLPRVVALALVGFAAVAVTRELL